HRSHPENAATLLLIREARGVTVAPDGTIDSFHAADAPESFTFSGVYVIKREILDFLPPGQEAPSILDAFKAAAAAGRRIAAVIADEGTFWSDVGSADEYIRAHGTIVSLGGRTPLHLQAPAGAMLENRRRLEAAGVKCTGVVAAGRNVRGCAGASLHNAVLWDDTEITSPEYFAQGIFSGVIRGEVLPPYQRLSPDRRITDTLGIPPEKVVMEEFPRQASGRRYARIQLPGGKSRIWCAYTRERFENTSFAAIAAFLKQLGIRVPAVLVNLPDCCEMLLEDLGSVDMLNMPRGELAGATADVLAQVARLHCCGATGVAENEVPLQPPFDAGLYSWERDYFRRELLGGVLGAPQLWDADVEEEWQRLLQVMLAQPPVPLHRDLQSANVKISGGRTWLIDFQGMRLGAAVYDVASMLYEPYLHRTPEERAAGWKSYCRALEDCGVMPPDEETFHAAAMQRLMQALGAYGKLWKKDGLEKYRTRITPALRNIIEAAGKTPFRQLAQLFQKVEKLWQSNPEYTDSTEF
ncbi:MAG: phosphotransferase, partial [Victivallales bacterium]|nr:phosphotransferase [Victivallales bacterium]